MITPIRRMTQGLFLLLFFWLFLQTEAKGANDLGYPVKIFLELDPLLAITTALASRSLQQITFLALLLLAVTILLGRVFCGWICPLGTLNNLSGALRKTRSKRPPQNIFALKYLILLFALTAACVTVQLTGIMDPLSLLIRSLSIAVYPLVNLSVTALFDTVYSWHPPLILNASEYIYGFLKRFFLAFQQPHFHQAAMTGLLFFGILSLNLLEKRFWCKYLCPLGALLGLCSRHALLRRSVSEGCNQCGNCTDACPGGAAGDTEQPWKPSECLACMSCDDSCPQGAVHFGFAGKTPRASLDLGKRRVLGSILGGFVAAPLMKLSPLSRAGAADPLLIRPPGSLPEKAFLRRCVKCGECMKVCLTGGLQPTLLEAGIEGIWSPILVPRIGYCEYRCTLCGQVCPTGAIRNLNLKEKAETRIGLAMIDRGRCLPYEHAIPCIVCQEVCPTPTKAIWLREVRERNREGKEVALKQPLVDLELCIGCGICETRCPIIGRPAITVTSVGESRSPDRQLLLP